MKNMNESRISSSQTASFNKAYSSSRQDSNVLNTNLFPVEQENNDEQIQGNSIKLPKPLLPFNKSRDDTHEFGGQSIERKKILNDEILSSSQMKVKGNLTFSPFLADKMFNRQDSILKLNNQHIRLTKELVSLNTILSELIDKKNEVLNEYENYVKQRKGYSKLMKNLEQQYEGYLYMLNGDYNVKLQQEYNIQKKCYMVLKKQVHDLNQQLSKPMRKNVFDENTPTQRLQKQLYELQLMFQSQKMSFKKKKEKLQEMDEQIQSKVTEGKKLQKRILKLERQFEDQGDENILRGGIKINMSNYFQQLENKRARLKKIKQSFQRNKQYEYSKRIKQIKLKQQNIREVESGIHNYNKKLFQRQVQLQKTEGLKQLRSASEKKSSKFVQFTHKSKTPSLSKANNSYGMTTNHDSRDMFLYEKASRSSFYNTYDSQKSMVEDRSELLQRRKRIYTQLEKNQYFKNIQNSQNQKLSRIQQTSDIFLENKCSHNNQNSDQFQKQNKEKSKKSILPQLQQKYGPRSSLKVPYSKLNKLSVIPESDNTNPKIEQNSEDSSIIKQKLKKSIQIHNKNIRQFRASNASKLAPSSNYKQICNILQRDRLLIQEDCEFDIKDLIYNSRY